MTYGTFANSSAKERYENALCKFYFFEQLKPTLTAKKTALMFVKTNKMKAVFETKDEQEALRLANSSKMASFIWELKHNAAKV